jgi:transcription-repair coupling factor (superfamily II helicase)
VSIVDLIAGHDSLSRIAEATARGRRVLIQGSQGSSSSLLAGAIARRTGRCVLLVVAHLDEADEAVDELASGESAKEITAVRFPALEVLPGESNPSLELLAERLALVRQLAAEVPSDECWAPSVIVCPIQALMQGVPAPAALDTVLLSLRAGEEPACGGPGSVVRWLEQAGYQRLEAVEEPGDFAVRGGIIDVFPAAGGAPVRLDFFADTLERLCEIDPETIVPDRSIASIDLVAASVEGRSAECPATGGPSAECTDPVNFLELVPGGREGAIALLHETLEVTEQARGYFERVSDSRGIFAPPAVLKLLQERFSFAEVNQFSGARLAADESVELPVSALAELPRDAGEAVRELGALAKAGTRAVVFCQNEGELQRFGELVSEFAPESKARIEAQVSYLHRGFVWAPREEPPVALVPYHELLHRFETRRRLQGGARLRAGRAMDTFLDFAPGDLVVHREHGIARFAGLRVMPTREGTRLGPVLPERGDARKRRAAPGADGEFWGHEEFLTLEFAKGAKLHVPATRIDQVQKYIGGFKGKPQLSVLGGQRWQRQKDVVRDSVKDLASELLRVRAAREHMPGIRFPADTAWQKEFEAEFPYEETDDQLAALAEIKKDMAGERPMDRLVCGDVGYGKTELAIRAAFKAVEFGKQVAVLVPTTVLAEQHERTFKSRFADYPFRVESLSRFKTTREINHVLEGLRKGHVDVVIGTHRLLSKDVRFADLGLVVIDEEQRFGVEHKERLLQLRLTADVLTLSATPIPRTLHMSMLGLRDISSLSTAPLDRRAVVTEVVPYNKKRIQQAIARELARDGQVFFVHNRIHNIQSVADEVQKLAGEKATVVVGHGQMPDGELEDVMLRFMRQGPEGADILVSTTIIESGIDIPTANTMFINDADRFGLSELHQLRGRVGRYKHRAYCYLLLPENRTVSEKAVKRLKAIEEFSMLGAGFKIAMRDLEIRGAGNILGPEQSGHIAAVGYEMYCQLLDRAVKELKGEVAAAPSETALEIGATGLIPKAYIPSDQRRMEAYRRIGTAATPAEVAKVGEELRQAYGPPPPPVSRLLDLAELRTSASALEVRAITVREKDVILRVPPHRMDEVADKLRGGVGGVGSVVALPPKTGEQSCEVYFRPPESYLEPATLLAVLRQRLGGSGRGDSREDGRGKGRGEGREDGGDEGKDDRTSRHSLPSSLPSTLPSSLRAGRTQGRTRRVPDA